MKDALKVILGCSLVVAGGYLAYKVINTILGWLGALRNLIATDIGISNDLATVIVVLLVVWALK